MTLNEIFKQYPDRQIPKCCEEGCQINLIDIKKRVIFKGEEFTKTQDNIKICDCFIFYNREKLTISLVELKNSSSLDADDIKEQFENGLSEASKILKKFNFSNQCIFQFILLTKNHNNNFFFDELKCRKIKVGKYQLPIMAETCNARLKDLTMYSGPVQF